MCGEGSLKKCHVPIVDWFSVSLSTTTRIFVVLPLPLFPEDSKVFDVVVKCRWEVDEHENILKTKYDSHWNSQSDLSSYPSTQTVKTSSMYENDKHLGPVAFEKPYGIGTTTSAPLSTLPKNGTFFNLKSSFAFYCGHNVVANPSTFWISI